MTITRFIPVGVGSTSRDLALSNEQLIDAFKVAHAHNASGRRPHIEFAEATPFCVLPNSVLDMANCCSYGYDRFYVDVTGELMVCGLSRIRLGGNILNESISSIKRKSTVYQSFIENSHVPQKCSICPLFKKCHGGCRAAALSAGDWKSKDPHMVR